MEKPKFIKTNDEETANKLHMLGYYEVQKEGAYHVFLNDRDEALFDDSTVLYTNILAF